MNPLLGVFYHWLGGLASGSFYVPFRGVKKWSWEVYWLAAGVFSWIFAPWIAASLLTNNLIPVLIEACQTDFTAVMWGFLFGMMWGAGGLTFGLTMRYLGMSLGMAVALSYCTVFGTIMGPIVKGKFVSEILGKDSGVVTLLGLGVCVLGIIIAAIAGTSKEREMSEEAKRAAIKEFNFIKGLLVATFSGIMSAGMSFGMDAAQPIANISIMHGTDEFYSQLPRLCVILSGGFTTNFLWCMFLFMKNKTGNQFFASHMTDDGKVVKSGPEIETVIDAPSEEMVKAMPVKKNGNGSLRVPMIANYIFCAMAGVTWYLQFFFYSLGETKMGIYSFSSWPLHMASIMIFSSLWGLGLGEWKGSSRFTKTILGVTLLTLIFSTIIMGYGTNIGKVTTEKNFFLNCENVQLEKEILMGLEPSPQFDEHLKAIVTEAEKIACFDPEAKKDKIQIKGPLADMKLIDQLSLNPEDAKRIRESSQKQKREKSEYEAKAEAKVVRVTELSKTVAQLVKDIPETSHAEVVPKVTSLAEATKELSDIVQGMHKQQHD